MSVATPQRSASVSASPPVRISRRRGVRPSPWERPGEDGAGTRVHGSNGSPASGQSAPELADQPGVARLLIGDAYIAAALGRHALRRAAGLPTDAPFLTTVFAVGVLANAVRRVAASALRELRPGRPSTADTVIAVAILREVPASVAGVRPGETRFAGTIIALSLLGPLVRRSARPALSAKAALARRYG